MNPQALAHAIQKDPMSPELMRRLLLIREASERAVNALARAEQFKRLIGAPRLVVAQANGAATGDPNYAKAYAQALGAGIQGVLETLGMAGEIGAAVTEDPPPGEPPHTNGLKISE